MADVWVVNSSPLIALERVGGLSVLARLAHEIVVPSGVLTEVGRGPRPLAAPDLGAHRNGDRNGAASRRRRVGPGLGESEVISWAVDQPGVLGIVDDRAGRRCATTLGVKTRGTIGVLLDAKTAGLLPAVGPALAGLRASGFFITDAVVAAALKAAGELR